MWTCRIHSLGGNAVDWGYSATRFEHKHFYQLFATHTQCPPLLHVHPKVPVGQSSAVPGTAGEADTASFDISRALMLFLALVLRCYLQHIPAKCGLMGQAWHRKESLVESLGFAGRLPARLVRFLPSLFSTSLKGKPPFALSLYSQ